jgi:hypothetical protein
VPLRLNELDYLEAEGLNVMLAHDFYPEGHQGGIGIIQNGLRVATNGDLRLEPTPGQWSPIPKVGERQVDRESETISVRMEYPDETKDRKGFNPIEYPDLHFAYVLSVRPDGDAFHMRVELESPLPTEWQDHVGFNLELYPGFLFGRSFQTESSFGVFPRQANGPAGQALAGGRRLAVAPECDEQRLTFEVVKGSDLVLLDGRERHSNGWFVVRGRLEGTVLDWRVTANVVPGFRTEPVLQLSQVGYRPRQPKWAVVELDPADSKRLPLELFRVSERGLESVWSREPEEWGRFLRFHYLRLDFSDLAEPGMYLLRYGNTESSVFQIGENVYDRHVWQPTVDTFLPVQMCHMRVVENYRVWHGACHLDDARMAPVDHNHFDGYLQGEETLCPFQPGEMVPGLNVGGWHDAGDYDLRVESQASTVHGLALAYEQFDLDYDNTTVDQQSRLVELQKPDGIPDVIQQVEHGALSIVGGYKALGRLYRGIIEPSLEQYVHLGDAATQTDNVPSDDDRWVFTEQNPRRDLEVAAALAAASRVLKPWNGPLAGDSLQIARELYENAETNDGIARAPAALELLESTGDSRYRDDLLASAEALAARPHQVGGIAARSLLLVEDKEYQDVIRASLTAYRKEVEEQSGRTPYGLPYQPHIWGAGWGIQQFGVQQYWLHLSCPDIFPADYMLHALDFVLGCHPGSNTASFISGVGARSMIPGYGVNRADFSYIPGGVGSGTALIRPDYPEFLEWPYLWQQTEYCLGNPTADYVFLVNAARSVLR